MGGVTIEDGGVTSANLPGMVKDDDLGVEGSSLFSRVILRIGGDVSTTNILDGDVPR